MTEPNALPPEVKGENAPVCPWCKAPYEQVWDLDDRDNLTCESCKKPYQSIRRVGITYTTKPLKG